MQAHHYRQAPNPDNGKIYFLTIEEGVPGSTKSCGIHFLNQSEKIDFEEQHSHSLERISHGKGQFEISVIQDPYDIRQNQIRMGTTQYSFTSSGGAFIASNVPGTIRVWDCSVDIDIPKGSDIDYLRWALPKESKEMR